MRAKRNVVLVRNILLGLVALVARLRSNVFPFDNAAKKLARWKSFKRDPRRNFFSPSFVGGIIDNTPPLKDDRVSNPFGAVCLNFFSSPSLYMLGIFPFFRQCE